ncbi:hypothetical protein Tco_0777456 [Tanacetum coccineum]
MLVWGKLIQKLRQKGVYEESFSMVPVQVKTMKIQAGVQVSRQGELRRHLKLWKCFGRLYLCCICTRKELQRSGTCRKAAKVISFNKHLENKTMYHAFIESLIADENVMDQGVVDLIKYKKRPHDDDDKYQDPLTRPDQGLKKRTTSKDAEPPKNPKLTGSSKSNTSSQPKSTGKPVQAKETIFEATDTDFPFNQGDDMGNTDGQPDVKTAPKAYWFKKPQRAPTHNPEWNKGKSVDNELISKLTKADLVGPVYNLLKGTCKSYVELEYNIEECYRSLFDQLDWNNPKGNHCTYDLSKPLSLQETRGRLTVLADLFFNNDLENLRGGNTDRKYTASITKTNAIKYDVEGIEDMVPKLWSPIKVDYDKHATLGISY